MNNLNKIKDHIEREIAPNTSFTLEWLESRLKPIYGPVMYMFTHLIDKGQLLYSHTKRILRNGVVIDELFYKRKK